MTRQRGFTLIEVMVVLSLLALIAVLAYGYFGSTMKEAKLKQAAVKIVTDLQRLEQAYLLYEVRFGTKPSGGSGTVRALLTDSGLLKGWPATDPSWKGADMGGAPQYRLYEDYDDFPTGLNPNADPAASIDGLTREVCLKVQELYSTLGGAQAWDYLQGHGEPAPYPADQSLWCETWDTDGSDSYDVILKIRTEDD